MDSILSTVVITLSLLVLLSVLEEECVGAEDGVDNSYDTTRVDDVATLPETSVSSDRDRVSVDQLYHEYLEVRET